MEKYREFEHAVHWLVRAYSSSWEQDIEICLQKYEYETDHETGYDMKVEMSAETYQVGAHFKALI